jgi:hypothetical protein
MSELTIEPAKLFPILSRYRSEAEHVLNIEEDAANRLDDAGDGGVLALNALSEL